MQPLYPSSCQIIFDVNGVPAGIVGLNSKEYLFGVTPNTPAIGAPSAVFNSNVAIGGGTINATTIGVTTPAIVKTSNLQATYTDSSGTPGNITNNSPRGRAAFAAAGTSVVVTSSLVTATSSVLVQLGGTDTTLTFVRVTSAAGSFTVTGNAAATAITPFDFFVIN